MRRLPPLVKESPAAYPDTLLAERGEGDVKLELLIDESSGAAEVNVAECCSGPPFEATR